MTPDTTPAPMTHEGDDVFIPKSCCIRADGACFEEGECLSDCEALDRDLLRGASERELRQRLERSERERNEWCTRADALAAERDQAHFDLDMLTAAYEERTAYVVVHKGQALACSESLRAAYSDVSIRAEAAEARIAELEAGIGRLAEEWYAQHAAGGHGTDILDAADELRSLLREAK